MIKKYQTHNSYRRVRRVLSLMLVVLIFAVAGIFTAAFPKTAPIPIPTPPPSAPSATYVSKKLGISFTYLTVVSDRQKFFTREIGNTIYLYNNPMSNQEYSGSDAEFLKSIPGNGFSIQVFDKDSHQSLIDSIKQRFLVGYSTANCPVHATPYGHPRVDNSYQTAVIDFIRHSDYTIDQLDAAVARCPKYVTVNGVSYFMMDPKHPDKLLFITIGQSNIPSGVWGAGTWDNTIQVLQ